MAKKRTFSTYSLSFLDIMSCGFGAVVLVFLIIKHSTDTRVEVINTDLQAEVNLLEEDIKDGQEQLVRIKNTVSELDQKLVTAHGLARRINEDIDAVKDKVKSLEEEDTDQQIKLLEEELKTLADKKKDLEDKDDQGNYIRRFVGQGDRQYLTGMNLGGSHILILLDVSASMLDSSIVNVIRRRYMSDETKRMSDKWQRAVTTVEWLIAQLPIESSYQIYTFNTDVNTLVPDSANQWLHASDREQLEEAMINMRQIVPEKGTSLVKAFMSITQFDPMPNNVFLITDGLPTQGFDKPSGNIISAKDRLELFRDSVEVIPLGITMNVLLWPMEGDPMAASEFWKLAQVTKGSFISPSKDWP